MLLGLHKFQFLWHFPYTIPQRKHGQREYLTLYIHIYYLFKLSVGAQFLVSSSISPELPPFQEKSEAEWEENPNEILFELHKVFRGTRTESEISPSNFSPTDFLLVLQSLASAKSICQGGLLINSSLNSEEKVQRQKKVLI